MSVPNCPIHVSVKMKVEKIKSKVDKRPTTKAVTMRTYYRCRVEGCPRVEEGTTFYHGRTWAGDFLEA